jgi:NAD(P)-dependent dehydrogenase (short-subunit alcohol dehydrogenase family)
MSEWTAADIPAQEGRTFLITGASAGVGLRAAAVLAARGASVILACRNGDRAAAAAGRIRETTPGASLRVVLLDLSSMASVRRAAEELRHGTGAIDVMVNNAGIMRAPYRRTDDGFELQLATNHLGHFAFTGLMLDLLLAAPGSRVVTVTSPAHRQGHIDFGDLQSERRYRRGAAYAQSKLANALFAYELQRRLTAAGAKTLSVAAHPGGARTELNRDMPWLFRGRSWGLARPITHSAEAGALPLLRAALDPGARGGDYYAPGGWLEFTGAPVRRESSRQSRDPELQRRLWEVSARLTGVTYPL